MWIVKLALARPYTFIVFSLVLLLISPVVLLRTPVDIFPSINIPVISVIWTYTGLATSEMATRAVLPTPPALAVKLFDCREPLYM